MKEIVIPCEINSGLITNEYAFWNPADLKAVRSKNIDITSGSLFKTVDGYGWTGVPDSNKPDVTSVVANNSAVFRMNTKRSDFLNVAVYLDMINKSLTESLRVPKQTHDGLHIWLRYISETLLYVLSINRRDNTIIIKKKVTGGPNPSNGGTYYELSKSVPFTVPYGSVQHIIGEAINLEGGKVFLCLSINGKCVVSAVDTGIGHENVALTGPGKIGIRGDNAELIFQKFEHEDLSR